MKRARYYFLAAFFVSLNGLSMAYTQQGSSDAVEVVVQGRRYESMRAYKREQIKGVLYRALSSQNLGEFSEDELCDIIKDVRRRQTAGNPPTEPPESTARQAGESPQGQQAVEEDAGGLSATQMQEMLKDYLKEHKDAEPLFLDPDKVKNIIIEPLKQPENTPKD